MGVVLDRLPWTLGLALSATLFGAILGVLCAMRSVRNPTGALSRMLDVLSYAIIAMAEFWLAIMLVLLFSVKLKWLPTAGATPFPKAWLLPAFILALRPFAQLYQISQATLVQEQ